jgi:hypothetical protein
MVLAPGSSGHIKIGDGLALEEIEAIIAATKAS